MRSVTLLATLMLFMLSGCSPMTQTSPSSRSANSNAPPSGATAPAGGEGTAARSEPDAQFRPTSLAQNENAPPSPPSATNVQRRVIRSGQFTIESDAPADGARRIGQIAEARGGYIVTSESRQTGDDQSRPSTTATITVRVPSENFAAAIEEIRGAGGRILRENITGQDVTEEYTDLEARIRAKQALEQQFIEIMRQARTIADALEVQRQLGQVRAEIEQMEGRRRLLENQAALSTIAVTLQTPGTLVNTSGFFYELRAALSDGIEFATGVLFVLIRIVLALLPVALFIFLPIALIVRYLIRRARRRDLAAAFQREAEAEPKAT